jgi:endonuclease/exonuclease/phosphatase family metal-dependent hydrolase
MPYRLFAIGVGLVAALLPLSGAPPVFAGGVNASVARPLTVMTRNLDAGTDYGPVFAATTFAEFLQATTSVWQEVQASNIPERMAGIAAEIAATAPDVVSLQEVTLFRTSTLPFTGIPEASTVVYDQLSSLVSALDADGVHYKVVDVLDEFDTEAPTLLGYNVRVTDRDAMLARSDLPANVLGVSNLRAAHYVSLLPVPTLFGSVVSVLHGWISADFTSLGRTTRVIATHLESQTAVATAQAQELLAGPGSTSLPVVVAGDFNTGPGVSSTYGVLLDGGLSDTWSATNPSDPGLTWAMHDEDPTDAAATPSIRIDLVLERGLTPKADLLVGATTADLTPSGLWPSDHAGVVASLWLAPPPRRTGR